MKLNRRGAVVLVGILAAGATHTSHAHAEAANVTAAKQATERAMQTFQSGSAEARRAMADEIIASPANFAPFVYLSLSSELQKEGRADDAVFWHHASILRGSYEAARCPGERAFQPIAAVLPALGEQVLGPIRGNPQKAKAVLARTLEWDAATPRNAVGLCENPKVADSDTEGLKKLEESTRKEFEQAMNDSISFAERQAQPAAAARTGLEFTASSGKVTSIEACPKATSALEECKTCCAALESQLTQAQADEVVSRFKTPKDLLGFSFRVPETIHGCIVQCSFADVARKL